MDFTATTMLQQFVNAILLVTGGEIDEELMHQLDDAVMNAPDGSDVKYLTKTLNESETDVLRKAISHDIHKFSQTPDFSDEQFAGNTTGVAIKYKLLALEYLAKVKERFLLEGLKIRLRLMEKVLEKKGSAAVDTSRIGISMNRSLPINELENAQMLAALSTAGLISKETLLTQISFVKNKADELEKLKQEQEAKDNHMLEAFNRNRLSNEFGM